MYCFYLLPLLICFSVNGQCPTGPEVVLRFRGTIIPNNSYILYENVRQDEQNRIFCITGKNDCCNFAPNIEGDWYLPDGERIRGGYEYPSVTNFFARSRGLQNIGLYHHGYPQQRGRFHCELPDSDGTNHTLFVNIVEEIPVITSQPVSRSVLRSASVTFSINLTFAEYSTYQWQKNNKSIIEEAGHYQGSTTQHLAVINAQEEDEGEYACVVDHFLLSHTAELSVG